MNRNYLFMAGEARISMKLAFLRDRWMHTMSPEKLVFDYNDLRRERYVRENLLGVIFYADVDDKKIEEDNLNTLKEFYSFGGNCWPNPDALLKMLDRHKVLKRCIDCGFVNHPVLQLESINECKPDIFLYSYVLKAGNKHRGIGKYLIDSFIDLPDVEGPISIEPFFIGDSVRVLLVGDNYWGVKLENDNSWIKNSSGAETSIVPVSDVLLSHARAVREEFGLEVAGVDYIVENNGRFHFLEINQYPGLDISDDAEIEIKKFLNKKMDEVEGIYV